MTTLNVKLKDNSLKERLKAQVRISDLFESIVNRFYQKVQEETGIRKEKINSGIQR